MNIYSGIRSILSNKNKGQLSKFILLTGLKPKINKEIVSPFNEGIIVFSWILKWHGLFVTPKLWLLRQLRLD